MSRGAVIRRDANDVEAMLCQEGLLVSLPKAPSKLRQAGSSDHSPEVPAPLIRAVRDDEAAVLRKTTQHTAEELVAQHENATSTFSGAVSPVEEDVDCGNVIDSSASVLDQKCRLGQPCFSSTCNHIPPVSKRSVHVAEDDRIDEVTQQCQRFCDIRRAAGIERDAMVHEAVPEPGVRPQLQG